MELYVHIPFCTRKCGYCAFVSFTGCDQPKMEQYVDMLLREASQRKKIVTEPIETVYIGGGTPSLLPPELTDRLLTGLADVFSFSNVTEFTVEANPGTVTDEWLVTTARCGVSRVSFGMQSDQDHLLKTLGRIHRLSDVIRSVKSARRAGFHNISLDLMFGIPGQTDDDWRQTLETAVLLSPEHISAYGLIPEEGTPLFRDLSNGILSLPDPELERDMYDTAITILNKAGFHQYELSNFSRPGYACRHNIGYWDQIPYLGIGISAASMIRFPLSDPSAFSLRWTNPYTFKEYYNLISHPEQLDKLQETVSQKEARFETVMLSLRMNSGMRRSRFRELHGQEPEYWYGDLLERFRELGLITLIDDSWRLTRQGMDIQNSLLVEFMDD